MPAAPYNVTATAQNGTDILVEGYCGDNYLSIDIYFDGNSVAQVNLLGPWTPGQYFSWTDTLVSSQFNTGHYYDASGVSGGHSARTSSNTVTLWHEDFTVYVSTAPTPTGAATIGESFTLNVGVSATPTVTAAFSEAFTVTVSAAASVESSQSIRTNYAHYLGDVAGKVYEFSPDYKSFNGASINSYWTSKVTDFSEMDLSLFGKWKTIYWVKIKYVDKSASTPVILSVSADNGAWSACPQQYIGTGDNGFKDAYFHMVKTGKYFQFRVEWPSADKTFQFTGLEVAGVKLGEEFKTT